MSESLTKIESLVLRVIRSQPDRWWAPLAVLDACNAEDPKVKVRFRNIHPTLRGLVDDGILESRWETADEKADRIRKAGKDTRGGKQRRLYRVTGKGRRITFPATEVLGVPPNPEPTAA